jgi:hypothetical protein
MTSYSARKQRGAFLFVVSIFIGLNIAPFQSGNVPTNNTQIQVACFAANGTERFGVNEVLGWPGLYPSDRLERSLGLMAPNRHRASYPIAADFAGRSRLVIYRPRATQGAVR